MGCRAFSKVSPWYIVAESEDHQTLDAADNDKTQDHSERNVLIRIFYMLCNRDYKFTADKQEKGHSAHGHDTGKA